MTFGLTPAGFVPKLIGDCEQGITDAMRSGVDPNFDMAADEPLGQMGSAIASEAAQLWEVAAACYSGINPNNAEGFVLDGVCAYTGTKRQAAKYSVVIAQMGMNASSSVPAGSVASVNGQPTNTWTLLGPCNTAGVYTAGPVVSVGAATYLGLFQATTTGPVNANAGQLTIITTPVSGWNTVGNAAGAILGSVQEQDPALNIRREEELSAAGSGTTDAMRADLLNVTGVIEAFVDENTGDVTDGNGIPPHSVHAIIYDGLTPSATNSDIAAVVWRDKSSGAGTYGVTSVVTQASDGSNRTVNFDRATAIETYVVLTYTTDSTFDVVNGPVAVKNAIVDFWESIQNLNVAMPIDDMRACVTFPGSSFRVQGVTKVTAFTLGTAPSPAGTSDLAASRTVIYTLAVAQITGNGV